jgi:hypothetical protein
LTEESKMDEGDNTELISRGISNTQKTKTIGKSKFYDISSCAITSEKQDKMKPDDYIEEGKQSYLNIFISLLQVFLLL